MASNHKDTIQDLQLNDSESSWIDTFSALDSKAFLHTFLKNHVRVDGRLFSSCRPTTITTGVVTRNASGSSLVCIGDTICFAAVSLQVGTPAAGFPTSGDLLIVTAPSADTTWLERVLRECGLVDFHTTLSIVSGKAAWRVQVVIMVLNNNGNTRDAMLLAAVAALRDTILPITQVDQQGIVHIVESDGDKKDNDCQGMPLCDLTSRDNIIIPLTVGFIHSDEKNTILLVDPSWMEQEQCESLCCMVVNATTKQVLNVELSGSIAISSQQLALVAQMAFGRAQELVNLF